MSNDNRTIEELLKEIDELHQRIHELEAREEIADLLFQKPNSLAIKIDTSGTITFMNDYSRLFFGGNTEHVGQAFLGNIIPDIADMREPFEDTLKTVIENPEIYMTFESLAKTPESDDETWIEWTFRAFTDSDFRVIEVICLGIDISRNKLIEGELKKAATTDIVTGLIAKNAFVDSFEREEYRFNRYGQLFSVVFASIANFQDCFDEFAPSYIDSQMKLLADIFLESIRMSDLACRWSGEEFIVMLPETNAEGAERAAGKIQYSIQTAINNMTCEIPFSLMFAATQFEPGKTLESIVGMALDKFDEAVAAGGNASKVILM